MVTERATAVERARDSLCCEHCHGIQWTRAPQLAQARAALDSLDEITASNLLNAIGGTIQAASNKLARLESLGVIKQVDRRGVSGGGSEIVYVRALLSDVAPEPSERKPTYQCQKCGHFTYMSRAWIETEPCPNCGTKHYWSGSFVWPEPTGDAREAPDVDYEVSMMLAAAGRDPDATNPAFKGQVRERVEELIARRAALTSYTSEPEK